MVDGAKDWFTLKAAALGVETRARRAAVQRVMRDVVVNTVMAVRGGYVCRLQDDEFKYMVAFPEPEVRDICLWGAVCWVQVHGRLPRARGDGLQPWGAVWRDEVMKSCTRFPWARGEGLQPWGAALCTVSEPCSAARWRWPWH